jgi:hypothetical protein
MYDWVYAAFALVAMFAGLATATVWSRRELRIRAFAVFLFLLALPLSFGSGIVALGWPTPYRQHITINAGTYSVLAVKMIAGKAIYVLLDSDTGVPRYFALPWDRKMADKLQQMLLDPKNKNGMQMKVPDGGHGSWSTNPPQFYPNMPPRQPPHKGPPPENPPVFHSI